MISTSPRKEKEAREHLGADHFIVSKNEEQMTVRHACCAACPAKGRGNENLVSHSWRGVLMSGKDDAEACCKCALKGPVLTVSKAQPRPSGTLSCGRVISPGGCAYAGRHHQHSVGQPRDLAAASAAGRGRHAGAAGRARGEPHLPHRERAVQPVRALRGQQ